MVYDFICERCKRHTQVTCSMHDRDKITEVCECGGKLDQIWERMQFRLEGRSDGTETGFYEHDYGKKATWDLRAKGKFRRLVHEGRIRDPFDDVPERKNMDVEL